MNKKFKVITTIDEANYLILKNHSLIKIDRDKFNRRYLIFIFKWNENLEKDLLSFKNK